VCNAYNGAFTMSGGTIYGKDDPSLANNADQGAAYYDFIADGKSNNTVKKIGQNN
jgi:hypothetical protein